jgi:hypothetical protein
MTGPSAQTRSEAASAVAKAAGKNVVPQNRHICELLDEWLVMHNALRKISLSPSRARKIADQTLDGLRKKA